MSRLLAGVNKHWLLVWAILVPGLLAFLLAGKLWGYTFAANASPGCQYAFNPRYADDCPSWDSTAGDKFCIPCPGPGNNACPSAATCSVPLPGGGFCHLWGLNLAGSATACMANCASAHPGP